MKLGTYENLPKTFLLGVAALFVFFILVIAVSQFQIKRKTRELKSINEKLRLSEEKYRTIADEVPDLHFRTDMEGKIVYISQSVLKLSGYTAEEAIGKNIVEAYVTPGDRETFLTAIQKNGYVNNFVVQVRHKDGSTWWAASNAQFYKDQDGNIIGIDVLIRDVTEQKLAQILLLQSEQRLQLALEGADLGMWDWNMQTNEVYFSPRYFSMLGYGSTELPHTRATWENLLHPDDRESTKQEIMTCIKKGSGRWNSEFRLRSKDGQYISVLGRGKIVKYTQDGVPLRAAGTHLDITDLKIVESALQKNKALLNAIIGNLPFDFFAIDMTGHYIMQNSTCRRGWGDVIGKRPEDLPFDKETITLWLENNRKAFSGDTVESEIVFDSGSGERTYYNIISPIKDNDSIIGILGLNMDITERKRMEEELLKIRKLESVGVLAGGIAHDFNNIMAAILGNISLALTITNPKDEIYELLAESEKASLRAKALTQQLLTFSKGGDLVRKVAAIDEVIKDSANFVLRGSNVRCDFKFSEELWAVAIDTGQISQVIQNIIINSSQAMPTGGMITIDCSNYCLESSNIIPVSAGNYIKIVIKDLGIGIPVDVLDKIFDPYFTTKLKGSGLGLAISHSIISKHDGYITVDSTPDQGTVFTIYLPASQGQLELESKDVMAAPTTAQGRIMIMDDEEMIRSLVERALSHVGYEVVHAEDGEHAVRLYKEAKEKGVPIDLIIMDLTIPGGMGGKAAVKKIHDIDPNAKVVVSSGYFNDPVMADFCEYGFLAAIVKPFQIRELIIAVEEAVSS